MHTNNGEQFSGFKALASKKQAIFDHMLCEQGGKEYESREIRMVQGETGIFFLKK